MKTTLQNETQKPTDGTLSVEHLAPEVNIFETKEGYVLEAEMPGVNKNGLEVTLEGTEITITGRRSAEPVSGNALLRERQRSDFRRIFELDPAIDTAKIRATMTQGVLTLILPKSEEVKPRRIAISE